MPLLDAVNAARNADDENRAELQQVPPSWRSTRVLALKVGEAVPKKC